MTEKELQQSETRFEHDNRIRSWIISIGVHVAVLVPMFFFVTCSDPPAIEYTEVMWGGSGGDPSVNAPEGLTPKGKPDASPEAQNRPTPQESPERPAPTRPTQSQQNPVLPANDQPTREPETSTDNRQEQTQSQTETQNDKSETSEDTRGSETSTSTKPAGGSGGPTVGSFSGGVGSRGWIRSPRATAPPGTNEVGEVELQFTVMPNGAVTNIVPRKRATPRLTSLSISALSAAKARPLPANAEQVPKTYTITYHYVLN